MFLHKIEINKGDFSANLLNFIGKNNKKENNLLNIFKIFFVFILFFFIIIIPFLIFNKKEIKKEILNVQKYLKICKKQVLIQKEKKFENKERPKISIISSIYNKEKYILRFLKSIQNQNYNNIEIILVDDFSSDNSIHTVENCQKEDKRIILMKNKKNKGTLISRNEGILKSKGDFIIIPDIDDILSKDILNQCFNLATQYNYDMIRFNMYLENQSIFMHSLFKDILSKSIKQPILSSFIFYGAGRLKIVDPMISNKFIKRNIIFNAINLISEYYLNQNMIFYEDTLINFLLYKTSESCFFLNKIGYVYISNPKSSTKAFVDNDLYTNKILNSLFLFLKFIFENTKNTKHEKNMVNAVIEKEFKILLTSNLFSKINNNFLFFKNNINSFIQNKYITLSIKNKFNNIKKIINKKMKLRIIKNMQ